MRKYAILKNSVVEQIVDLEDCSEVARQSESIIDITDSLDQPEMGWVLRGSCLYRPEPIYDVHQKRLVILKMRFVFGNKLADDMVLKMSNRNLELIDLGQVLNINAVIATFDGVEKALRKCAIPTAKTAIIAMRSAYVEYQEQFDFAISEINNYFEMESRI